MRLLTEAMNGLGAVLLQMVTLLALEELTFGGLVRLMMARQPEARRSGRAAAERGRGSEDTGNNQVKGEEKCLH